MPNTFHDQLTGSDLHENKVNATTGTELTPSSLAILDGRWPSKAATDAHLANTNNPHGTNAGQVGAPPTSRAINTNAPLVGGGDLSANRTLSLPQATSSQAGYLSSTDWAAFNARGYRTQLLVGPPGSQADYICTGTNDQATILTAYNAVGAAGGGTLRLLPGTYNFDAGIILGYGSVTIEGGGVGATIIRARYASNTALMAVQKFTSTPANNVTFRNFSIDLNGNAVCGIQIGGVASGTTVSKNYLLENIEVYGRGVDNTGSIGALTFKAQYGANTGPLQNITLRNVEIRDGAATDAAHTNGTSIIFFSNNTKKVRFENCYFHDTYGTTIAIVQGTTSFRGNRDWVWSQCRFENTMLDNPSPGSTTIYDIGENRQGFDGVKILGCSFSSAYDIHDTYSLGIYNSRGFIVSGTTFYRCRTILAPGHSYPTGNESKGWTFSGNIIYDCYSFADFDGHYAGTYENNIFYGLQRGALLGGYGTHTTSVFRGNTFYNCCQSPTTDAEISQGIFMLEDGGNIVENNVIYQDFAQAAPAPASVAANSSAGVLTGSYTYKVTLVSDLGETAGGATSATLTVSGKQASLSNIPIGAYGTRARNIYRTAVGGADGSQKLVATLPNNTATTYTDNTPDGSLGVAVPTVSTQVNNLKYVFCEFNGSGVGGSPFPNIYRNNAIMGAGATSKTFLIDSYLKHVIQGNVGLTESRIQYSFTNATAALSDLSGNDVVQGNVDLNNRAVSNPYDTVTIATKTTAYTLTATDSVVLADATSAALTVTLPSAVGIAGRQYTIKRINSGSNNVNIGTTSSQTIDGSASKSIGAQYSAATLVSDGANWQIVNVVGTVS